MTSNWFVLLAIALESGGIASLFSPLSGDMQLVAYLTAHAMACGLLSLALLPFLPRRYRGQPVFAGLFLFSLQFAIPFIGSLGVLVGILLALYLPRSTREVPWQEVDIPELPFRPIDMNLQTIYSQGGLRQVLREASNPDKRLKALMATRQMADREAVDILREALKDPADDVRLLAYSMLEQKEKTLTQRASLVQQALKQSAKSEIPGLKRRLAQVWWEMAYLGLAQGGLRNYYLNNAADMLEGIILQSPKHSDWRLMGRVELARGNLDAAEKAFKRASASGAPPEAILPYLAELAFLRRDFAAVREHLRACPREQLHPANRPLLEAWL